MSQSALPNNCLFSSFWTQLIVKSEKLSFFQIYKTQNRGGGFGRELHRAADHQQHWDLPPARDAVPWLLSPSRQAPQEAGRASRSIPPPARRAPHTQRQGGTGSTFCHNAIIPFFLPTQASDSHTSSGKWLKPT